MQGEIIYKSYNWITTQLEAIGTWFPQLVLRLILAWEFGEAGIAKYNGENWFATSHSHFRLIWFHLSLAGAWRHSLK